MVMELMKNWEVIVDGFQIFLCLLILFLLIRNHRRKLKLDLTGPKQELRPDFDVQVFSQTISQQIELAFSNIQNTVDSEYRNIQKVMKLQQDNTPIQRPSVILPLSTPNHSRVALEKGEESVEQDTLQRHILKLSARGLNPKQIADELKAPLGEVDLILNMKKSA